MPGSSDINVIRNMARTDKFAGLDEMIAGLPKGGSTGVLPPMVNRFGGMGMSTAIGHLPGRTSYPGTAPSATAGLTGPARLRDRSPILRAIRRAGVGAYGRVAAIGAGFGLIYGAANAKNVARSAYLDQADNRIQSRYLQNVVNTHRVGPRGMGQSSYLSPLATSASGMTLALHYQNQSGMGRKAALGMSTRNMNYRDMIRTRTGF